MLFLSGYLFLEFFFLVLLASFFVFTLQGVNPNLFWIERSYDVICPDKFWQVGPKRKRIGPKKKNNKLTGWFKNVKHHGPLRSPSRGQPGPRGPQRIRPPPFPLRHTWDIKSQFLLVPFPKSLFLFQLPLLLFVSFSSLFPSTAFSFSSFSVASF